MLLVCYWSTANNISVLTFLEVQILHYFYQDLERKKTALVRMAEEQDQGGGEDVEESLRNERKKRQEYEQRVAEMERKIQKLNEKNKQKEMKEQEDGKKEEKQKVDD